MDSINELRTNRKQVVKCEVIISRENIGKSSLIHITDVATGVEILNKWVSEKELSRKSAPKNGQYVRCTPYAMLFYQKIRDIEQSDGFIGSMDSQNSALVILSEYIEMGTGRLIRLRKKNGVRVKLSRKDMANILGISESATARLISDMKKNGFLTKKKDGYYIPRDILCRGRGVK